MHADQLRVPCLLTSTDPAPVEIVNPRGRSAVLLTCEHAGRQVPARLGGLGLEDRDLERHIGHDIGAEGLSRCLAGMLGATLILQRYSRLVIDCNRPLGAPDLAPAVSDGTRIPANAGLTEADRMRRYEEIHAPLHAAIAARIEMRRPQALIAVHSFNPVLGGEVREMHVGLLYNRDGRLAVELQTALGARIDPASIALNRPYAVDDDSDETIPRHGEATGIPHVLLEIRNDCIATTEGQRHWAAVLGPVIRDAVAAPDAT